MTTYTERLDATGAVQSITFANPDGSGGSFLVDYPPAHYVEWVAAGNAPRPAPPSTLLTPTWDGVAWVEGAPLADVRAKKAHDLIDALGAYQQSQYPAGVLVEIEAARGRGAHAARIADFDAWKASVLAHYRTALAAINTDTGDHVADIATVQAATWDFAQFDASNPHLTIAELSV